MDRMVSECTATLKACQHGFSGGAGSAACFWGGRLALHITVGHLRTSSEGTTLALFLSASGVTKLLVAVRPSDRRERCVNALLAAVAVPVQPPALPGMARPRIT